MLAKCKKNSMKTNPASPNNRCHWLSLAKKSQMMEASELLQSHSLHGFSGGVSFCCLFVLRKTSLYSLSIVSTKSKTLTLGQRFS